jgi:hypothetical protein
VEAASRRLSHRPFFILILLQNQGFASASPSIPFRLSTHADEDTADNLTGKNISRNLTGKNISENLTGKISSFILTGKNASQAREETGRHGWG